ncbi:uncharacterized protein TNCV_2480261 [Trichonephila clavipes]|nr:uncharacterized protein TNCV_2480261 [Trichonephila clavipes]
MENNKIPVLTPNNWNRWKRDMQVILMHYGYWQFIIKTEPMDSAVGTTYKEKNEFFGTKYQLGEDVGIYLCRVKTEVARLQEAGHKVDDLYLGFQINRYLPEEFRSTDEKTRNLLPAR